MLGPSSPQERKKHPEKLPNNTFNIHIPLPPTQCGCTGMTLLASIISLARKILVNESVQVTEFHIFTALYLLVRKALQRENADQPPSCIFFPEVVFWPFFSMLGLEDISTPLREKRKP